MGFHSLWILVVHPLEAAWFGWENGDRVCTCGVTPEHYALKGAEISYEGHPALVILGPYPDLASKIRFSYSPARVILFGYSGALCAPLEPGVFLYPSVIFRRESREVFYNPAIDYMEQGRPPVVYYAPLLTVDKPVRRRREREALHSRTGAWSVDMESYNLFREFRESYPETTFQVIRMILDGPRENLGDLTKFARRRHRQLITSMKTRRAILFQLLGAPLVDGMKRREEMNGSAGSD